MIAELNTKLLEYYEKVPLFGIILFTEEHPNVVQTLKNKDYYAALDLMSGSQIAIFVTMLFRGEYRYPQPPPGVMAQMVPIWQEPCANKSVLSWFDIQNSLSLPLFVLFAVYQENLYYQKHPIRSGSAEEVYASLQEVLTLLPAESIPDIHILFKRTQWKIRQLHVKQAARKVLETVALFRGALGP